MIGFIRFYANFLLVALMICGCTPRAADDISHSVNDDQVNGHQPEDLEQHPSTDLTFNNDKAFTEWQDNVFSSVTIDGASFNKSQPMPELGCFLLLPWSEESNPSIFLVDSGRRVEVDFAESPDMTDVVYSPPSSSGLIVRRWLDKGDGRYRSSIGRIDPDAQPIVTFGPAQILPVDEYDNRKAKYDGWKKATFSHDGKLLLRYRYDLGTTYYNVDSDKLTCHESASYKPVKSVCDKFDIGGRLFIRQTTSELDSNRTSTFGISEFIDFNDDKLILGRKLDLANQESIFHHGQNASDVMMTSGWDGVKLQRLDGSGSASPMAFIHRTLFPDIIKKSMLASDGSTLYVIDMSGHLTTVDCSSLSKTIRIGEDTINCSVPQTNPDSSNWPEVVIDANWQANGSRLDVEFVARNLGKGKAWRVNGELVFETETGEITLLGAVPFGCIEPGESITRRASFLLDGHADAPKLFTLRTEVQGTYPVLPVVWLHILKDTQEDAARKLFLLTNSPALNLKAYLEYEEAYHAKAKQIFNAGYEILAELTGRRPKIEFKETTFGVGFSIGLGTIEYQNPFDFGESSTIINRQVINTSNPEIFKAHTQMMLYWYIPHELIHAFDAHGNDWFSEYVGNTVQPCLTARILKKIDSPFDAETMANVYSYYVSSLRHKFSLAEIRAIEKYALGDGTGSPSTMSAMDMFRNRTDLYVYFGARINQRSWAEKHTLEELVKKYVK